MQFRSLAHFQALKRWWIYSNKVPIWISLSRCSSHPDKGNLRTWLSYWIFHIKTHYQHLIEEKFASVLPNKKYEKRFKYLHVLLGAYITVQSVAICKVFISHYFGWLIQVLFPWRTTEKLFEHSKTILNLLSLWNS